ncbi:TRAP transporter small permease subunit [Sneathiella chinensis]|uniref:TRAP transporter small permease protein n=1 Tax=Sneathiella chinensis TaxID=349750 RepID=A0ABQ5U4B0_9PROT|nr:TRAP transporter small permease subunit [Sneathiella chinensis]GLQ06078.1 C4-dicarboxylate ABC transporter [Sneathiella chinensis]
MRGLVAFARAVTATNAWIGRLASYAVLLLFILLLGDVIMRYVTQSPVSWSSLASKMIFGVYAIIGGGYLLARRDHVNVDLFYGSFSPKKKALTDIATSFLFFLFLGVLLTESFSMATDSISRMEVSYETTWRPYIWPSKTLIFVAAALLLLQGIVKLIADIMILLDMEVDETAFGPLNDDDIHEKETV